MSAGEMERAVRRAIDAYNRGELSVIDAIYDRGYVYHGNGEMADLTRDGWTRFLREMMAAFPDMHIHVDEIFTSGDRLCYRMTVSGTHKGELLGLPPTNRKISI
ncbi:MAG: ester cyclase, partial [Nitrososphaerota archaeon]